MRRPLFSILTILFLAEACAVSHRKEEPIFSANFREAVNYYLGTYDYYDSYSSDGAFILINISSDTLGLTISSWPGMFYDFDCYYGEVCYDGHSFIISRNYLTTNDDILSSFMNIRHVKRLEEKEFIIRSIETGTGPEDYVSGFFLIQNGRLKPLF